MRTPRIRPENPSRFVSDQSAYIVSVPPETSSRVSSETTQLSSQEMAVASVGLLMLFGVWFLVRRDLRRRKTNSTDGHGAERSLSRAERLTNYLPCTRCRYFKANMYLPCAVNPTVALKPEAVHCADFHSRDGSEITEATG